MKNLMLLAMVLVLSACGSKMQEIKVDGSPGLDGISMGIDVSNLAPTCLAGGTTLSTFVDADRSGSLDMGEVVKNVAVICNGINGTNGTNGIDGTSASVATASAAQCPAGGIVMTVGVISTSICNGSDGSMGPAGQNGINGTNGLDGAAGPIGVAGQAGKSAYEIWLDLGNTGSEADFLATLVGPQGQQGADGNAGANGLSAYQIWLALGNTGTQAQFLSSLVGPAGSSGSVGPVGPQGPQGVSGGVGNMTPVQLCPGDTASFKEFGFIVGTDLYAVYFDKNQPIAFLAKLSPGSYVTTNGSNCHFSYANNGTTATLTSSSGTTTVPLNTGSGSGSGNTLAGSCAVSKYADHQSEQQFHFSVTGMASYTSYTLEVTFNNGSSVNQVQDSNGGASTYNNPLYTIAPQNSSQVFDFYAKHNGNVVNKPTVATSKVKKGSQEMICTVAN